MGLEPGLRIGKYELGKKLGQGGFGVVFLGHDTELDRDVALKFMHAEHTANAEILRRFLQEARSAAKIVHPGIVTVFEARQVAGTNSEVDGIAYIAMELLHGESLADRLEKHRKLSPTAAMEIVRQTASALEAAHAAGIIHRDLKPDNIFLMRDPAMPGGERVKVLDFGIAKLAQAQVSGVQTHSQMVFGTPRYMSPEQCRSAAYIDHRSDIYTLGCILFELVTGEPPFTGEAGELIAKHQMVAAPTARSLNPTVPLHLDALITQMLAKPASERPQTMGELARILDGNASHSGSSMSAGVALTLLPDSADSLQRFTPTPGSLMKTDADRARAAVAPTTLGSANASHEIKRENGGRKRIAIFAISGAIVVAGVVAVIALRGGDKPADTKATQDSGSTHVTPPPPPATKDVEIELTSTPPAQVYMIADGRLLGETPYHSKRAPAEGSLVFLLRVDGYKDERVVVPADHDFRQTIAMTTLHVPGSGTGSAEVVVKKPPKPPKPPRPGSGSGTPVVKPGSGSSGHIEVYPE